MEFLLGELEEDYDESYNMCICRLIVSAFPLRLMTACIKRTIYGHYECRNVSTSIPPVPKFPTVAESQTFKQPRNASSRRKRQCTQKFWTMYHIYAKP
jgi:hypothetical protein